jgi:diguanylate cyclase (GGDEF)-like protein
VVLIGISAVILLATDSVYTGVVARTGFVAEASPLDLGWLASYWVMAWAFLVYERPERIRVRRKQPAGESVAGLAMPYLAVAPLLAFDLLAMLREENAPALSAGSLIAIALIVVRQWLMLKENRRLYGVLESERRRQADLLVELDARADELERLRVAATFAAEHDDLTGLLNRTAWFARAGRERPAAIALFDIDRFKKVNDLAGHPAGDRVLREVAAWLRRALGEETVLARFGGDEFGAAFFTTPEMARQRCARAVEQLALTPLLVSAGGEVRVTVSAGFAELPADDDLDEALTATYERADELLYEAKRAGRGRLRPELPVAA